MNPHQLMRFSPVFFELNYLRRAGWALRMLCGVSFSTFRQTANQKWKVPESTSHLVSFSDRFSGVPSSRQ